MDHQDCISSGDPRENPFPCQAASVPWLMASLLITLTSVSVMLCPFLTLTLLPLSYKDLCDYIKPIWIIQGNLSISKSLI